MKRVDRSELLDLGAYEQIREPFRNRVIALKARRRLELGQHMSLVFENHDTVLLQIQEMLRTERISDERAIAHELETYNELIPAKHALSACLFIEYTGADERKRALASFASLRQQIHVAIGSHRYAMHFGTHHGEELDRLPAVNYLTVQLEPTSASALRDRNVSAAIEISHPDYPLTRELSRELREELAYELES